MASSPCATCGETHRWGMDHDAWLACRSCNASKGRLTGDEFIAERERQRLVVPARDLKFDWLASLDVANPVPR